MRSINIINEREVIFYNIVVNKKGRRHKGQGNFILIKAKEHSLYYSQMTLKKTNQINQ